MNSTEDKLSEILQDVRRRIAAIEILGRALTPAEISAVTKLRQHEQILQAASDARARSLALVDRINQTADALDGPLGAVLSWLEYQPVDGEDPPWVDDDRSGGRVRYLSAELEALTAKAPTD